MKRKLFVVLALTMVFLCSCGNNISQEEHIEIIEESDVNSEEQMEQIHTIVNKDYAIDKNELKLALVNRNEKIEIQLSASASDYEYGSIIFAYFYGIFRDLPVDSFNIIVWVDSANVAVIPTSIGYQIMGNNSDGSPTLSMPDWIVEEFALEQDEINVFYEELEKIKNDFTKIMEEKLE